LNAETGERIRDPLQLGENVFCLAFSPDGTQIAAGSTDGNVRVFDVATGETVVGPINAHKNIVTSLIYTHDGQQFITASWDESIRAWEAATGQQIGDPMLGHENWIWKIALNRDGRRLASVSDDFTARVWDLKTRRQIGGPLQFRERHSFTSASWSPDGCSIVAGHADGGICLWDAPPLDDHPVISQVPAPTTSIAPLPSTSQSRANSTSSSILNVRRVPIIVDSYHCRPQLPAGSSPTPPQSPEAKTSPDEDDDQREYSTNESFDSVLDAPADVTQPTQRRRRRRRRKAPVAANSSPPIPVFPSFQHHQAPTSIVPLSTLPRNRAPAPPGVDEPTSTPEEHAAAGSPTSRVRALRRLWRQRPSLSRWTRRKSRKTHCEPHESQPVHPSPTAPNTEPQPPSTPAALIHSEVATSHAEATTPKPNVISRLLARSKRQPIDTTPENIEMHPRRPPRRRTPAPHTQRQSEVVNVAVGRLDRRMAASSNKWTDKIDWLDYICFCMCCPWNKVISESDSERGPGDRPGGGESSGSSSGSSLDRVSYDPDEIY
ncbi:WD40-repeat-containing domain protein, partial [Hygrophoropsis aurantiaca]